MLSTHFVQGKIVGCVGMTMRIYEYSGEGIRSGCWNGQAEWLEERHYWACTSWQLREQRSSPLIFPGQFFDSPELSSDELLHNFLAH